MKAAYINETGDALKIIYGDLPDPVPEEDECLVKVDAVSVNPIDTYIRSGKVPMDLPLPYILGCDFAGVIEDVGDGVEAFKPGDRVWGSNQGLLGRQGTFAERIAVNADWIYPAPEGVSSEELAAVALVGITAHLGLFRDAQLQAGETLFVHGGSGGVGAMVVQMAKIAGARVITTAGGPEKAKLCRELGADEVIDYRAERVSDRLNELAKKELDVWWETLREPDFDAAFNLLRPRGRMILMAGREARPSFPVGPFYVKELTLKGFVMFMASSAQQRLAADDINKWLESKRLKPLIGDRLPLGQAREAHQRQEEKTLARSSSLYGKIVLNV